MQKAYLLLLILFFPIIISAQINSGEIKYKVIPIAEMENALDTVEGASADAKDFVDHINEEKNKMLPHLIYQLEFNQKEALFSYPQSMAVDNKKIALKDVAMHVGLQDKYYFNSEKDKAINQRRFFHDEILLINSKISHNNWKILSERKTIAGYECQKAVIDSYDLIEDSYVGEELVVWFTKEIPFSFGPGLAGLPGMILGLELKRFYIYADEVELNQKEKKITPPSKGRKITGKEFQKELEEAFRKMDEGTWDWDADWQSD